jgi:hypothetical protein
MAPHLQMVMPMVALLPLAMGESSHQQDSINADGMNQQALERVLPLHHALPTSADFSACGSVSIQHSEHSGSLASQPTVSHLLDPSALKYVVTPSMATRIVSITEIGSSSLSSGVIPSNASRSTHSLLIIKAIEDDGRELATSVDSECVLDTSREHFTLHFDTSGWLEALEVSAGKTNGCARKADRSNGFNVSTSARARFPTHVPSLNPQAPRRFGPPGSATGASHTSSSSSSLYGQNSQAQHGPDGQQRKPESQKSFLEKYWMYIIPFLFMLLQASQQQQQQQQQQQGGSNR